MADKNSKYIFDQPIRLCVCPYLVSWKNTGSFRALIIAICVSFQIGCTGVSIKPEDRSSILEVSVDKAILAETPAYYGPENTAGAILGGAIGSLIASQVLSEPEHIAQYLKTNNIDISQIVSNEFKTQLENQPIFSGKIKESAKTHFRLKVEMYGLFQDGPFSSTYKPILGINAQLIDANKGKIWEKEDYVSVYNDDTPSSQYEQFFQSPETFRNAFAKASKIVVYSLLDQF